jgi:hypothetical protein
VHKITLAPPPLIEVPVSSPESDRPCTYVGGGIEFVSASTLFRLDLGLFVLWYFSIRFGTVRTMVFFYQIWDCSYCGIFRLDLGLFVLWYFSFRFGTVRTVVFFDQIWYCSYYGIFRLDLGLFVLLYFSFRFGTVRTVVFFVFLFY